MAYITKRLNAEERAYWEECLRKAIPYTEEEMDSLPFDGDPDSEDRDRADAYVAQKILEEDGALIAAENK